MEHDERDVVLTRVVELLGNAGSADGAERLHPLLTPDVVLRTCDAVVIGAEAVASTFGRWAEVHGTDWEVLDVVDGGDRMAVRFGLGDRQGALFLAAGDDGRLATATVASSAA